METVAGSPSDCVRVDGSSAPCGGVPPNFIDNDSPAGLVDGSNVAFALTGIPSPISSLALYRNGILQKPGQDFTLAGNSITFLGFAPEPGDTLLASYRLTGSSDATPQLYPNPQVLCSGLGAGANLSTLTTVGSCTVPSGFLVPGDRIEIHFDLDHQGTAGGFTFEVHWGASTLLARDGTASDALVTGRAEAALTAQGAQWSHQSWGSSLAFAAGIGTAADDYGPGITIDFRVKTVRTDETVTLKNFTVIRLP
jgi:hypothetical protein